MKRKFTIELDLEELELVLDGLDAQKYWQLAQERYRCNGYMQEPGSDDPEAQEEIKQVTALEQRFEQLKEGAAHAVQEGSVRRESV